jgi:Na+/H+ antiporter NhaA
MAESTGSLWRDRTQWSRRGAPLREFLRTESGSAGVLVAAVVAALVWANIDITSYEKAWHTTFTINLGNAQITREVRDWVNSGLMTLFFLVVGLEARREFDLGDLRDRKRFILPALAGVVGMVVPVLIYLAVNSGHSSGHGWGVAMSTDTALALGVLAGLGRDVPDRVRVFLLTLFVVDDLIALCVIAFAYSDNIDIEHLILAIALFAVLLEVTALKMQQRWIYTSLGVVIWASLMASGVDPVVTGLAIGLSASAYPPARTDLEEATVLVRLFREQPTPGLARSAGRGLTSALSPNERLQSFYHPWTSYLIVPLFALANAGIELRWDFLRHAYTTPITLGILLGYVLGKPIAIVATSYLVRWLSRDRLVPPVGWAALAGSGTIAGIGFTVALLIADRAFTGEQLAEAKLGALSAAFVAAILTAIVYRLTRLLSPLRRAKALLGDTRIIQDLIPAVDPERDHVRGPKHAHVTVIEFGDFECPYCGQAEPILRELLADTSIRFVWRNLPLPDVHPNARLAAEAAEAAGAQGKFWEMHDLLLANQSELQPDDLMRYAAELGLDTDRFETDIVTNAHQNRIEQDIESADVSGANGTPTFFINGQRHYGAYDIGSLKAAVKEAKAQAHVAKVRRQEREAAEAQRPAG